ncbi:MAG: glycosyltransferase family 2 protein [Chloroflexi bacterium]|nr:glycosyltransferase family 2 protein [Chloroflexota bacterium]
MAMPASPTRVAASSTATTTRPTRSRASGRAARADILTVSIIMPTYRRGHTIQRTVRQILAQSYPHWELIVVNNSRSGDYHFADPRVHVYRHASHASVSYARNEGLAYATGDIVCFFDDDDDMFPTYLERIVEAFADNPEASVVRCGMLREGGKTTFSYAAPLVGLRRSLAVPTWTETMDQAERYFGEIIEQHGLSEERGDIIVVPELLVRAHADPKGGLRNGRP